MDRIRPAGYNLPTPDVDDISYFHRSEISRTLLCACPTALLNIVKLLWYMSIKNILHYSVFVNFVNIYTHNLRLLQWAASKATFMLTTLKRSSSLWLLTLAKMKIIRNGTHFWLKIFFDSWIKSSPILMTSTTFTISWTKLVFSTKWAIWPQQTIFTS